MCECNLLVLSADALRCLHHTVEHLEMIACSSDGMHNTLQRWHHLAHSKVCRMSLAACISGSMSQHGGSTCTASLALPRASERMPMLSCASGMCRKPSDAAAASWTCHRNTPMQAYPL